MEFFNYAIRWTSLLHKCSMSKVWLFVLLPTLRLTESAFASDDREMRIASIALISCRKEYPIGPFCI